MWWKSSAILLLLSIALTVPADGNLAISETAQLNVSAASAWARVRDFNAMHKWHPAVAGTEILEGENNAVGAVRLLTLQDGGTIKEKLTAWDDAAMSFSYVILEGVLPVQSYSATLVIEKLTDNTCKIIWSSSFSAGAGADDRKATDTIRGIYIDGLNNLAQILK